MMLPLVDDVSMLSAIGYAAEALEELPTENEERDPTAKAQHQIWR